MNENNDSKKTENHEKKKRRIWLLALLLILLLFAGYVGYDHFWRSPKTVVANIEDVDNEFIEEMSPDQLKAYLQEQADKDYVQLKVDSQMTFDSKESLGNVNIQNPPANDIDIRVRTYLKGTKKLVYDSGKISPKEYVTKGKLVTPLSPGTYETNSQVLFYDQEKGTQAGEAGVTGHLIVE